MFTKLRVGGIAFLLLVNVNLGLIPSVVCEKVWEKVWSWSAW